MEDTIRETVVSEIIMTEIAEKNKIVQFPETWINLEFHIYSVIQSEVSQRKTNIIY